MFHLKKYVNHDDQEDHNQQHSKAVKFPVSTFQAGPRSVFSGNEINFETLSIFVVFCTYLLVGVPIAGPRLVFAGGNELEKSGSTFDGQLLMRAFLSASSAKTLMFLASSFRHSTLQVPKAGAP